MCPTPSMSDRLTKATSVRTALMTFSTIMGDNFSHSHGAPLSISRLPDQKISPILDIC